MGLNKAGSEFVDDGIDWHSFIVVQTIDLYDDQQTQDTN